MIKKQSVLYWSIEMLVVALLIWVCMKIDFIFRPILVFISVVFVPVIISLFLYYMMRPIMSLLMKVRIGKHQMSRGIASILIVLVLILIICGVITAIIPPMVNELTQIVKGLPTTAKETQRLMIKLSHHLWLKDIDFQSYYKQMTNKLSNSSEMILRGITAQAGTVIGMVTSTVIVVITVPVMLFYMLRDSNKFVPSVQKYFSKKHGEEIGKLLHQMNDTLSSYIAGQAIECIFVAIATSIGYLIIGQPVAIVLGIVAGLTNMIPYVGPYIGITPALMVSLAVAPQKLIWVVVVVVIVQQIDGNIIYPNIIGRTLQIHPLTIIMLLLAAGNIAGIPGMILCIPFYAVVKTIFNYVWSIYQIENKNNR